MAAKKKTLEYYNEEIKKIDMKIDKATKNITLLKQEKQILNTKINEIKAFTILGAIEESELSYSEALELLQSQNPVISIKNN